MGSTVTGITRHVQRSMGNAGPLFIKVLGKTFVFATRLVHRLGRPCRVAFTHCSSCGKADAANIIHRVVPIRTSIGKQALVVVRSVVSAKFAVRCIVSGLHGSNTTSIGLTAVLFGPSSLEYGLGPSCVNVQVPDSFVINCNLSCSRVKQTCQGVCGVVSG